MAIKLNFKPMKVGRKRCARTIQDGVRRVPVHVLDVLVTWKGSRTAEVR